MGYLRIQLDGYKTAFVPGETVSGTISWQTDTPATSISVRLFWYTQGKGTSDVGNVNDLIVEQPSREGTHHFEFVLPDGPYSFSGKLISLVWALEVVAEPTSESETTEFIVSPTRNEVVIGTNEGAA